jgi:hypothetical protein
MTQDSSFYKPHYTLRTRGEEYCKASADDWHHPGAATVSTFFNYAESNYCVAFTLIPNRTPVARTERANAILKNTKATRITRVLSLRRD